MQATLLIHQRLTCVSFLTGLYLECNYGELRCLGNTTNMPEGKLIWISSTFSQTCKQETKYTISDIGHALKENNCVMLILIFERDMHKSLNKCISCQIFSYFMRYTCLSKALWPLIIVALNSKYLQFVTLFENSIDN